jgi:hypothetical protein
MGMRLDNTTRSEPPKPTRIGKALAIKIGEMEIAKAHGGIIPPGILPLDCWYDSKDQKWVICSSCQQSADGGVIMDTATSVEVDPDTGMLSGLQFYPMLEAEN